VKQGVQLLLERVQRHRAFPRLAAANGQNLPTTLSPVNAVSHLGRPRFIPVLAERSAPNSRVQESSNIETDFDFQDRYDTVSEGQSIVLSSEPDLMTQAEFSNQEFENNTIQEHQQILEINTPQAFEQPTENSSNNAASEIRATDLPNEVLPKSDTKMTASRAASDQVQVVTQQTNRQDSSLQAREPQTSLPASLPTPIPGTSQPRETPTTASSKQNTSVEVSQTLESEIPQATASFESEIPQATASFESENDQTAQRYSAPIRSEPNQIENVKLSSQQPPVSTHSNLLETEPLSTEDVNQINDTSNKTPKSVAQQLLEQPSRTARNPSRLESTLESLRQFAGQPNLNESAIQTELGSSQPAQPGTRAVKTAGIPQQVRPSLGVAQKPNVAQRSAEPDLEASTSDFVPAGTKAQNPTTQDSKISLEAQALTPENPAVQTETSKSQNPTIENIPELDQTEPVQSRTTPFDSERGNVDQLNLTKVESIQAATQTDLDQTELRQLEPTIIEVIEPNQTNLESQQTQIPRVQSAPTELPQVPPTLPQVPPTLPQVLPAQSDLKRDTNLESATDQKSSNNTDTAKTSSNPNIPTALPVPESNVSEQEKLEAAERVAYQRSVMLRAERSKRALAAKEELERDLSEIRPQTLDTSVEQFNEPQQNAVPDVKPLLESQNQSQPTPNIETILEPQVNTASVEARNTQIVESMTSDPNVAVESNSSDQIEFNDDQVVTNQSTGILDETPPTASSEIQASELSQIQASELSQIQASEPSQIQASEPSQIQASEPSQTPSSSQVAPSQDLPPSSLKNTEGVNVYNPQRRVQRVIAPRPPKPKPEPNAAEKLFAEMPTISEQDVINIIRKAQGLPPIEAKSQAPNPVQTKDTIESQNTQANSNLIEEILPPTEQDIEQNTSSLTTTPSSQANQNARVEQVSMDQTQTQEDFTASSSNADTNQSHDAAQQPKAQTNAANTRTTNQTERIIVDAHGGKVHIFNPPNRRVVPPRPPKPERQKNEAERFFDALEVTETADELFQRVVKNRLKPDANTEPQNTEMNQNLNAATQNSSIDTPIQPVNQGLRPNLPNLAKPQTLSNQAANQVNNQRSSENPVIAGNPSVTANSNMTGNPTVQLSQNAIRFLKPIVGIDPNEVKIYRDPQSERLTKAARADALTIGDTILLSNQQPLESPETLGLIAHELTHVARNRQTRFVPPVARGNVNLESSAQAGNEEGLALGVEALARQGWTNLNQTNNQNMQNQSSNQTFSRQTTPNNADTDRSRYGGLPAPADMPQWFIKDGIPPQASTPSAPRTNASSTMPATSSFVPQAPTNTLAASMGAQAASQGRDIPTPPPAAGPLPESEKPKPEPASSRAAPDLDAMARQVYTILKRRLANERHRM
jgi:Domain of unknown function (DUF4157)